MSDILSKWLKTLLFKFILIANITTNYCGISKIYHIFVKNNNKKLLNFYAQKLSITKLDIRIFYLYLAKNEQSCQELG